MNDVNPNCNISMYDVQTPQSEIVWKLVFASFTGQARRS